VEFVKVSIVSLFEESVKLCTLKDVYLPLLKRPGDTLSDPWFGRHLGFKMATNKQKTAIFQTRINFLKQLSWFMKFANILYPKQLKKLCFVGHVGFQDGRHLKF
jgi:hypothetical protein